MYSDIFYSILFYSAYIFLNYNCRPLNYFTSHTCSWPAVWNWLKGKAESILVWTTHKYFFHSTPPTLLIHPLILISGKMFQHRWLLLLYTGFIPHFHEHFGSPLPSWGIIVWAFSSVSYPHHRASTLLPTLQSPMDHENRNLTYAL